MRPRSQIYVSVGSTVVTPLVDEEVNEMSALAWILIAVVVIVVLGIIGWSLSRRRRSARLREHFGPEYDRTVGELGEQRAAEAELAAREKKRKKLDIVDLTPEARQEHDRITVGIDRHIPHREIGCRSHVARLEDLKPHLRE